MKNTVLSPNMPETFGSTIPLGIEKLTAENLHLLQEFSCGNDWIDDHFRNTAVSSDREVTFLFNNLTAGHTAAAVSLSCASIPITSYGVYVESHPAVEITCFAVDLRYQKLRMSPDPDEGYFSDTILSHIISDIYQFTSNFCGASHILLHSTDSARHFYERNQFREITEDFYLTRRNYILEGCTPMMFVL